MYSALGRIGLTLPYQALVRDSAKRTRELFAADFGNAFLLDDESRYIPFHSTIDPLLTQPSRKALITNKIRTEYDDVRELPPALAAKQAAATSAAKRKKLGAASKPLATEADGADASTMKLIEGIPISSSSGAQTTALAIRGKAPPGFGGGAQKDMPGSSLVRKQAAQQIKPVWHPPWKLMRVIAGHLGWVRALAVEPGNQWFCTGAGDRTVKIWDLASGNLKLTLTGHISTVRGLAVSPRHPYLFSCGEDKMVKCWDLESNRVIRHYHGHLSGVYSLALHPTLDVLVTSGRDGVARVWDMRTRTNVMVLSGHQGTVSSVVTQEADPQVITGSMDSTVRLWDLAAGKTMAVLTHHKKSVRTITTHPKEFTFASGSADNIKQWKCPEGAFMQNFEGFGGIVNTLSVNEDDILFSGCTCFVPTLRPRGD